MVMHARKPQRISDGYFEKHQAHPYQKYKSERRTASDYVSADSRYSPLHSPNGNVTSHGHGHTSHSGHGHHHYSHFSDERGYVSSRNSYVQKGCEKERDRDYKSSRDKYTDSVRSPKDKRSKDIERERSNHERSDADKKSRAAVNISVRSSKYDKRAAAPATEHTLPSSGEWSEHISSSGKKYYYNCISEVSQWEKPREWDTRRNASKDSTYSSRSNHDKRSTSRTGRESEKPSKRANSGSDRYWNRDEDGHERNRPKHSGHEDGQSLQDMDISPDRSTPLSENSYGARDANSAARNNAESNAVPPVVVLDNSNQPSGSLLAAALPRIVGCVPTTSTCTSTATAASVSNNGAALSPAADTCGTAGSSGTPHRDAGPPTPTHSENVDPHAPPLHLENALPRKMESLGSYSSVVGGALHAAPMMTPSLVNYVRTDLTAHVTAWPAELLEKQANKYSEEAYQLGLQCARVTAELKCSRSVVRHTEISATLHEQKIMYLRQQISRLEVLKSQNSFMSDD